MIKENRPVDAVLPEDIAEAPTPIDAPPPEISPEEAQADARAGVRLWNVFRHRNYRLFFAGQIVSLMGTWITTVTQGWLVYQLTHSPLLLGLVSFSGQVPVFFFSAFGGMIADRFDRRHLVMVTQGLACAQSAALAILTLTHVITVWQIVALALFQGFINAFDVPARQAMTVEMVGKRDLRHAISLNSMMFNLARIVGPTVAGVLIALVGTGLCFALDALSYAAVLLSLYRMRFARRAPVVHSQPLKAVREGFAYAWSCREIRVSLLLIATCSAFGASYIPLLPAFARDVLGQGSEGLGLLYGAVGAGALTGAYALARVPDRHLFVTPVAAAICFATSLIAFSFSHFYWLSFLLLMPTAFSLMLLGGSTNTIIQLLSRESMRGRVVALYAMCFMGMTPWGSLLLGAVAEHAGAGLAVTCGATVCLLGGLAALYDRRGAPWKLEAAE
jgi:MFS family permease